MHHVTYGILFQSIGSSKTSRDPERMYKIVLAGDAAVGKSSFIMRLCKGKFVPNLSSTLGANLKINIDTFFKFAKFVPKK